MMQSFLKGDEVAQTAGNDAPFSAQSEAAPAQNQLGLSTIPVELLYHIFQFLPAFENLQLREVSKSFCAAWETVAKEQLSIATPDIWGLTPDEGYADLHEKQQAEISYLTRKKSEILKKNNNDERIDKIFERLELLENNANVAIYHAKEKLLNSLNEIIIRRKIPTASRRDFVGLLSLKHSNLTRFPDKIFSDATLNTFWTNLEMLYLSKNQLTTLPNGIGKCVALLVLSARNNELIALPNAIGQCIELRDLHVTSNQLSTLPDSIEQCTQLRFVSITKNRLKQLPTKLPGNIIFFDEKDNVIDEIRCLELQKPTSVKNEETEEQHLPKRRRLR